MADGPVNPLDRVTARTLDAATRDRLFATLEEGLARASREALARGMSPAELAAQLDDRIARLRAGLAPHTIRLPG